MEHWYHGDCPNCHNIEIQQHLLSAWCVKCGWARNKDNDPATGRPVARFGLLGNPEGKN